MKQIYKRLRKAFPFLGTRPANEEDILTFLADHRVEVVRSPFVKNAVYVVYDGVDFIFINDKLRGVRLLHRLCHELGHFLFHAPTQNKYGVEFFDIHWKKKNEEEAEAVAALLMLPLKDIKEVTFSGIFKYDIELSNLIATRLTVAKKLGGK
jgi:Zn-dependent peptidase ImmA (M78 family)